MKVCHLIYVSGLQKYNLTVMVSDGLFQNTASVLIEVTDVNDNEPEFDQEVYEITDVVEETVPPPDGQFLLQVSIDETCK